MNERAEEFRRITMRVLVMQLNSIAIMDIVAYGGAAAGIAVSLFQFQAGAIDLAGCLMIMLLAADYFLPMRQLGSFFHIAMNGMAASDKIFRLLNAEEPAVGSLPFPTRSDIRISGLGFAYQGDGAARKAVLINVNLAIPEGSFTAIVGESGSGKSTLLKLFMRFWLPDSGSVEVSGRSVSYINTPDLRALEAFVTQDTHLFRGTIKQNLLIAKQDASDEEIEEACRKASVHEFICTLPQGYDTPVGELGDALSGGERQRIGLARAFLHDAPFLLLDEPTSNLDSLNEAVVLRALAREHDGRTVLLVSHRALTMRIADTVISVERGRVC